MDDYAIQAIKAILDNDLNHAETMNDFYEHGKKLVIENQINFIELREKKTNKVLVKVYKQDEDKWDFHDYCWINVYELDYPHKEIS